MKLRDTDARRLPVGLIHMVTRFAALLLLAALATAATASAATVRGKVLASDTGELMAFVDVLLIPADSTARKIGGVTNADGTFALEAPAGTYTLQVRALSYATKRLTGLTVGNEAPSAVTISLESSAIVQQEVVVEAQSIQNNEKALLAQRRKASTVGDAVSAEQMRKAPDRDAADVLRRVTGLSVSEGKFVFVRGLGERYSSTEVDGVRLVSPEQNKRVVPLDLLPANLLDNVVIQKTYSADRPAEFGGGDVQVHTRDFPSKMTFQISASQGYEEGATFKDLPGYLGSNKDRFGMGSEFRDLSGLMQSIAGHRKLTPRGVDPTQGIPLDTLAMLGKSFRNIWSTKLNHVLPNGSLFQTFGNEWKLFGRPLGLVQSATYSRSVSHREEKKRFFQSYVNEYDYLYDRTTESVQLGGLGALSYRLSPGNSVHLRTMYTRGADDETRLATGYNNQIRESIRSTRLTYVERSIFTGGIEGRHELPAVMRSKVEWKLNRSTSSRLQPDRRETSYQRFTYIDDNEVFQEQWSLAPSVGGGATREYGDQADKGWGFNTKWSVPVALGPLGKGRLDSGFDHQAKERDSFYRRLGFRPPQGQGDAPPESLFQDSNWRPNAQGAQVRDLTFDDDNYEGSQRQTAGFVSGEIPFGPRVRSVIGVRVEHGTQRVRSYDLFDPARTTALGEIDNVDWLPAANVTWAMTERANLRLAASRTLSRPDLREFSPSKSIDDPGGFRLSGNPDLKRARLDNYDVRIEAFPALAEVLAIGAFYKKIYDPIETAIRPGDQPFFEPVNSKSGKNLGLEVESRTSLGRFWKPLANFFLNANFTVIASRVELPAFATVLGGSEHPLAGQAAHLVNASLSWTSPRGGADAAVLFSRTGTRLTTLGILQPDVYEAPISTLDASVNWTVLPSLRMKLTGKGLLREVHRTTQGEFEITKYEEPSAYSIGFTYSPL